MTKEVVLETKELRKEFTLRSQKGWFRREKESVKAVNGVSLKVHRGESLGIVGESGCGKSTFAKLITRLTAPTAGRILYQGQDITTVTGETLQKMRLGIQMIFQDPYASLDPRKRILHLLTEPLEIHQIGTPAERKEKALVMLEKVGLQRSYAYRFPHEFSGGQCQRINIARALMLEPEVIICDEPVSALDVSIQAQVINLLIDLQEQLNLTYVFISHDLNIVRYFCDRIAVMYMGEVVEYGEAEEVYHHPQHEYTKKLLAAIPGQKKIERE